MKKPSKSFCSVCPKNIGHKKSPEEESEVKVIRKPKVNRGKKPLKFAHSSINVMRKLAILNNPNIQRRHKINKLLTKPLPIIRYNKTKIQKPFIRPIHPKRNTFNKLNNQYYGVDHLTDVPRPSEGDTYLNILTGDMYIHTKDIWNLIPNEHPKCLPIEQSPIPKEGDVYFEAETGRVRIYQNKVWTEFSPSSLLTNSEKQICESTYHDANNMRNKTFRIESVDLQLSGEYNQLSLKHFEKINPIISDENSKSFILEIAPEGVIDLDLKFNLENVDEIEFSLESWVKYSDSDKNIWQTVTCLSDLELINREGQSINNYKLTSIHQDQLIDLKQKLKTFTTLANNDKILIKTKIPISQIRWKSKLLAYLVNNLPTEPEFYSVEFKDLYQSISLPQMSIQINPTKELVIKN